MKQQKTHISKPQLKLPTLSENDDIEDFLQHFDAIAIQYDLSEKEKILYLTSSLTDKARQAFLTMPTGSSYAGYQDALRRRFFLSPEAYRKKFREARKASDESFVTFGERLNRYLDSWSTLSKTAVRELFLIEQLCAGVSPDLVIRIRENKPTTLSEALEVAESYAEARRGSFKNTNVPGQHKPSSYFKDNNNRQRRPFRRTNFNERSHSQPPPDNRHGITFYNRNELGGNSTPQHPPRERGGKAPQSPPNRPAVQCFHCGKYGHVKKDCRSFLRLQQKPSNQPQASLCSARRSNAVLSANSDNDMSVPTFFSQVEGRLATTIRDTGATHVFVDERLVPDSAERGPNMHMTGISRDFTQVRPKVLINVSTPYYKGKLWAITVTNPICDLFIGNTIELPEGTMRKVSTNFPKSVSAAVQTRSAAKRAQQQPALQPVLDPFPTGITLNVTKQDVQRKQESDKTLDTVRTLVDQPPKPGKASSYTKSDGIIYRVFSKGNQCYKQLVVPKCLRGTVLKMGHDMPMAGHLGSRRTLDRVQQDFYWPGINQDVRIYCRTCDACQRTTPKGKLTRVPVGTVPLVTTPFSKVGVDLVGPITPPSNGYKYILVIVDYATRYPEAVPLRNIEAITVAEALWNVWTRVGVPDEIITDNGTQFTAEVMQAMHHLIGVKPMTTTPYHAQANGLVERFNATLKQMLKRLCLDHPRDWHRYIPAVLFAYREVPQESMRFSPFELLYGRTVKGPMSILRKMWTQDKSEPIAAQGEIQYVLDLKERLATTCEVAKQHLKEARARYKKHFDKRARERWYEPGDEVLLLLPEKKNKLQIAWRGPYKVMERIGDWDYRIKVGARERLFHANLLKKYVRRKAAMAAAHAGAGISPVVIEESNPLTASNVAPHIPVIPLTAEESWEDVSLGPGLNKDQRDQAHQLAAEFSDVLTDLPLRCNLGECTLELNSEMPVRVRPYPLPHSQAEVVRKEVQAMLDMGVIERTSSPYSAPIVLVKKKDGKIRFCIDYRQLNKVVVFDSEPMPDVEQLFANIGQSCFFTKLDLTKGYWQIPMAPEHQKYTAFSTPQGQFQWKAMPFGLKTAGAVFSRIMRALLDKVDSRNVQNFIDDVLVATTTWEEHLIVLRKLFLALREAQLSAKPSKCFIGFNEVPFLGFILRQGKVTPEDDKTDKIRNAKPPQTKKELRAFLGLAGYYRKFVPNFAEKALPLTEKTKGRHPDRVKWDEKCQESFDSLKKALCAKPVLLLPDQSKPFTLRTDASNVGLGAIILQDQGDGLQPVAYASKKLNGPELNYHTIELECMAVVWGIRKFYPYLYGRHFTLESDHHPLRYLDRIRPVSKRLMGWAIELQSHSFDFRSLKGVDNLGADYLSRAH